MILLWSGGCDSTYLLYTSLKNNKEEFDVKSRESRKNTLDRLRAWEAAQKENPGVEEPKPETPETPEPIRTISIIHPNVWTTYEQRRARQGAIRRLVQLGYQWQHIEVVINHHTPTPDDITAEADFHAQPAYGGLVQPLIWVPMTIQYLMDNENLALGYVKGDDIHYYLPALITAFDQLQWVGGRTGKLKTPLDCTAKAQVIDGLKKAGLYKHTWYCEDPKYKKLLVIGQKARRDEIERAQLCGQPCGKCSPCMAHATALWQLKTGNYTPAKVGSP